MSKKPDSSCVLSIIIAGKLCIILSVLIECLRLSFTTSPISAVHINKIGFGFIMILLSSISITVIVLDIILMFSTFVKHFSVTKRLIIADLWIQVGLFVPVLIWIIVFIAMAKETSLKAPWTDDFDFLEQVSHEHISINSSAIESEYYDWPETAYLDTDFNINLTLSPQHLIGVTLEEGTLNRLLRVLPQVEKVQQRLKCCGLQGPSDWLKKFSGPIDPETQATSRFLWWSQDEAVVDVPPSCCIREIDGICARRYGNTATSSKRASQGCWTVATTFVQKFTLTVASVLLILILLTIPRNIWLYKLTETRRRRQRAIDCHNFAIRCKRNWDNVRYLKCSTKPQEATQSTQSDSKKSLKTATGPTLSDKTARTVSNVSKETKESSKTEQRQSAGFDVLEPELVIDCTFDSDSSGNWI